MWGKGIHSGHGEGSWRSRDRERQGERESGGIEASYEHMEREEGGELR